MSDAVVENEQNIDPKNEVDETSSNTDAAERAEAAEPKQDETAAELKARLESIEKALTALAPKPEPTEDDETDYKAEFQKASEELSKARAEVAVIKAAGAAGINAAAALDSTTVMKAISEIDHKDSDKVVETLKNLASKESHAWLRAPKTVTPPRATATGAPESKKRFTKDDFNRMTLIERAALKQNNPNEYSRLLGLNS